MPKNHKRYMRDYMRRKRAEGNGLDGVLLKKKNPFCIEFSEKFLR